MNTDVKRIRRDIIKLEKLMQNSPTPVTVMNLAEKYVDIGEPHQAVATLMEGMEKFPSHATLHVLCARFMVTHQTHDVTMAESLIKHVLEKHPDNLMAQQLMEQIHTCVETMHEVARPFGDELSELPTLKTQKVIQINESDSGHVSSNHEESVSPFHIELTEAYRKFHNSDFRGAIELFQKILEESPDNTDAREGFRITCTQRS